MSTKGIAFYILETTEVPFEWVVYKAKRARSMNSVLKAGVTEP